MLFRSMKNENILKLEINNKTKHLEKHLRPQWTWRAYVFIFSLLSALTLVVIDLEINFVKLFSDSSKYLGDIISRMLPPDFSNFQNLIYSMIETIEIAFLGTFIAITLSIPIGLFSARNLAPNYGIFLAARTVTIFFRAIPEFIIAMVLVIAIGYCHWFWCYSWCACFRYSHNGVFSKIL